MLLASKRDTLLILGIVKIKRKFVIVLGLGAHYLWVICVMGLICINSLLIGKVTALETVRRCHLFKVATLSLTESDLSASKTYRWLLDRTDWEQIWQVLSIVRRRNNFLICGVSSCPSHVILIWKLSLKVMLRLCFWEVLLQILLIDFWISRIVRCLNLLVFLLPNNFLQNFCSIPESCLIDRLVVSGWAISILHLFFAFKLSWRLFWGAIWLILLGRMSIRFFLAFSWFCRNFLFFCRTFSHLLWQSGGRL